MYIFPREELCLKHKADFTADLLIFAKINISIILFNNTFNDKIIT